MTSLHQLKLWQLAAVAFLAMCAQDVLATIMVVSEASYNAALAGAFDTLGWLFGIVCSGLTVVEIVKGGWLSRRALTIILSVSGANFLGTVLGVQIASILMHHR